MPPSFSSPHAYPNTNSRGQPNHTIMDRPDPNMPDQAYSDCKDAASLLIAFEAEEQKIRQRYEEMRNSRRVRQAACDRQVQACIASIIYPRFIHDIDSF
jgi:hypothetical protein